MFISSQKEREKKNVEPKNKKGQAAAKISQEPEKDKNKVYAKFGLDNIVIKPILEYGSRL